LVQVVLCLQQIPQVTQVVQVALDQLQQPPGVLVVQGQTSILFPVMGAQEVLLLFLAEVLPYLEVEVVAIPHQQRTTLQAGAQWVTSMVVAMVGILVWVLAVVG
jgi:hypothetical protein